MLYIHSGKNKTYVAINSKLVNVYAGDKFVNTEQDKWFQKLSITTTLGTTDILAYDLDHIDAAVNKVFNFIINCKKDWFTSDIIHVVELEDIYDSDR